MALTLNPLTGNFDVTVPASFNVASVTQNGVVYGNAASAISATTQGPANSVLTANAGAPSFSASPTIGTSVTCPLHIGGTGTTSPLTLQSTSGSGVAGADIIFKTGANGATECARFLNSGFFGLGQTAPSCLLRVEQATTFGTYTSHQNTASLVDATGALFSTLTAATPNLFHYGLFIETKQTMTGSPVQITAALNALVTIISTDNATYNAADLAMAGFYVSEYGGTGTYPKTIGVFARSQTSSSGTLTNQVGGYFQCQHITTGNGTVTNQYGIQVDTPASVASHTVTNTYGLRIEAQVSAAGTQTNTPFGIYQTGTADFNFFGGKSGFGTTSPQKILHVSGLPRIDSTTANGTVATAMSSLGPTGSHTTIQEWLTIDINGTTRYIPCF